MPHLTGLCDHRKGAPLRCLRASSGPRAQGGNRQMKPPEAQEPHILVTGVARSGTSWLGRALGDSSDVDYVFEPDNVDADPRSDRVAGARGFGPYPVIAVGEHHAGFEALWDMVFQGTLPRRRGLRLAAGR